MFEVNAINKFRNNIHDVKSFNEKMKHHGCAPIDAEVVNGRVKAVVYLCNIEGMKNFVLSIMNQFFGSAELIVTTEFKEDAELDVSFDL